MRPRALLRSAGFTQDGDKWKMPNGDAFEFTIVVWEQGVMNGLGTIAAQMWSQAGVPGDGRSGSPPLRPTVPAGDYEASVAWAVETWGGHPDLSFFLDSYHSEYIVAPGEIQPARNWMRWQNPELDKIIEEIRGVDFNDLERNIELGKDFVRLHLQGHAQHPGDVLQRVLGDVGEVLDGLPDLREPVHRSGEQLGQLEVHLHPDQTSWR